MIDTLMDGWTERARVAKRLGVLTWLKRRVVEWAATEEPDADPTARLSSRDWADLPPYHPRDER